MRVTRPSGYLVGLELRRAPRREVVQLARDLRQRFCRHVLDHRHHEPFEVQVHRDADVYAVAASVTWPSAKVALRRGNGEPKRDRYGAHDKRQMRERKALALLPEAVGYVRACSTLKDHFDGLQDVRHGRPRLRHVLRDALAHAVERPGTTVCAGLAQTGARAPMRVGGQAPFRRDTG